MLQGYLALAILFLVGCSSPADFAKDPVTNNVGQTITFVNAANLHSWVKEHQNNKIIAITGYSGESGTDGYVIVFNTQVEK